jgi:hypothetical protein
MTVTLCVPLLDSWILLLVMQTHLTYHSRALACLRMIHRYGQQLDNQLVRRLFESKVGSGNTSLINILVSAPRQLDLSAAVHVIEYFNSQLLKNTRKLLSTSDLHAIRGECDSFLFFVPL